MFYVNNEQVKGMYLNGISLNYLAYGFGKIIPEDRNAEQLNLNLAYKYLDHYRVEYGTMKDGYENALVSPRFDEPDPRGVFCTPFTYYYSGNIVSTKNVPVLITDGNYALINALVYNDMNIDGAINHFASNTDFQGHNINVAPEKECFGPLLNYEMLNNCSNFDLNISTRFSKATYPTLVNCYAFSGNYRYVGNKDNKYPGFRGFLRQCRAGVFNIDCTNMHGGGNEYNVTNYYNFRCISNCNNIKLNITGSPWQAWVHPQCYSGNCNITTRHIVPGFDRMNHCNFNIYLPSHADVEKEEYYSILSNSYNCNVYFDGTNSNLYSFRNSDSTLFLFQDLNNCNLNLLLGESTGLDYAFGNRLNNCNIVFDNIKADLTTFNGWCSLRNCNISGNVEASSSAQGFLEHCDAINVNLDVSKSSRIKLLFNCINVRGNINWLGNNAQIEYVNGINISRLRNGNVTFNYVRNGYFRVNNTTFKCYNTNNTEIYSEGSRVNILGADNCYNLKLSGLTFGTPDSDSLFENVYKSDLKFGTSYPYYRLWRVENCGIDGFPRDFAYVKNCVFRPFNMKQVSLRNSEVGTWNNVWPHRKIAGIRSMDNISSCRISANEWRTDGNITFNNVNNMQTSFGNYYNGIVTANLPIYNMNIKFNVDCTTLNLGIFQAGPPHGFRNATISANNIFRTTGNDYYVQVNCDTKIYCENYCNVCFQPHIGNYNDVRQPVVLINNYQHANSQACNFFGGLTRIGRLHFQGGTSASLNLINGACVFINNTVLGKTTVMNNSLLFLGTNVYIAGDITVRNGGRVRNAANLTNDDIRFIDRGQFCWNLWDYGPWGPYRLIDYCTGV